MPDFLVLFSSMSSVAGGVGHVDYCAANAFLDAFAQAKRRCADKHVVSINWNTWQGVGMAASVDLPRDMKEWKEEIHSQGLTPQEGIECFARIVNRRVPQVAVCTQDVPTLLREDFSYSPPEHAPPQDKARVTAHFHERPAINIEYAGVRNETERKLAEMWQELLGIHPVGIHDNFFLLGGHSLLGTRLVSRLRSEFGVHMPLRELFERPTVAGLAAFVAQTRLEQETDESDLLQTLHDLDDDQVEAELVRRLTKGAR
jgi:acyl carrier protein